MNITHGNILAVFFSASRAEIQEGRNWYSRATNICVSIAKDYELEASTVAGIVAALSPNNRWQRNITDAEALIRTYRLGSELDAVKVSTYSKNKDKAIKILKGENPLDVLGGLKVRSFYRCITGCNDVCIDGHAFAIWNGQRITTTKTPSITPKLYAKISEDYRVATSVINQVLNDNFTAVQVQAVTWVTWRNLFKGEAK